MYRAVFINSFDEMTESPEHCNQYSYDQFKSNFYIFGLRKP